MTIMSGLLQYLAGEDRGANEAFIRRGARVVEGQ